MLWRVCLGQLMAVLVILTVDSRVAADAASPPPPSAKSTSLRDGLSDGLKVLRSLQAKMVGGRDLSVRWEQIQYKALRDRYIKSQGTGQFSYPQRFVWDLESISQAWLSDGKVLYHLDRRANKALAYSTKGAQNQEINRFIGLITRFDRLTEEYYLRSFREDETKLFFELEPKQSGDLRKVKVAYLKAKAAISLIQMNFASGNYTKLSFSHQHRKPLAAGVFRLPKQVKIQQVP